MQMASSASWTWSDWTSASEYTARVLIPSSRHARTIRRAISPRLAMRIFWIIQFEDSPSNPRREGLPAGLDRILGLRSALELEEPLAVFHRLAVLDQDLDYGPLDLRLDLVHD